MQITKTKLIFILLAIIILPIVGWYFSRPQGAVELALAPQEVTFSVDGKERTVTHNQKISFTPGTYEVAFSRDGFQTEKTNITVKDNEKIRVVIALTPLTDEAKKMLADSAESQKVIKEYKSIKHKELISSLPLSGVNYAVNACRSVRNPKSDTKAVCIATTTAQGEKAAMEAIKKLGYDTSELEILVGTENIRALIRNESYRIDYYEGVKPEGTDKLALFITPLKLPFIPYGTASDPAAEAVRTAALNELKEKGYDVNNYAIYYSNIYLSKYNPDAGQPDEHAMPPTL